MMRLATAGSLIAMVAGVRHADIDMLEEHDALHQELHQELGFDESKCPKSARLTKRDREQPFLVPQCLDAEKNEVDARCCALSDTRPANWRGRVCPKGVFPELCVWEPNDDGKTIGQVHDGWKGKFAGTGLEYCKGNLVMVTMDAEKGLYAPVRLVDTHKVSNFESTYMKEVKIHKKGGKTVAERTDSWPWIKASVENNAGDEEKLFSQGDLLELTKSLSLSVAGFMHFGRIIPVTPRGMATYHYVGGIGTMVKSGLHRLTGWNGFKPVREEHLMWNLVEKKFVKPCNDKSWQTEDEQDEIDKPPPSSDNSTWSDDDDDHWPSNSDGSNSDGSSSDGSTSDGSTSDGSSDGSSDDSSHDTSDTQEEDNSVDWSYTAEDHWGVEHTYSNNMDKWD